jgi:uncharacterized membrane protein (DUF485 family)
MVSASTRLLRRAAWAPIAVLILHAIVAETPYRQRLDFAMHFSGGAAIAYFLFVALHEFREWLGTPTPFGRYIFSFAMACTVGVFWEIGEFISDVFLHTHIQKAVSETMSDLVADATGALFALALVFIIRCFAKTKPSPAQLTQSEDLPT